MQFTEDEKSHFFLLVRKITGCMPEDLLIKGYITNNVANNMVKHQFASLADYINAIARNDNMFNEFVSSITIHTTTWFRENVHLKMLDHDVLKKIGESTSGITLRVWCSASSTGQEVYSIGLVLESLRTRYLHKFDYEILASDIDMVSLRRIEEGFYNCEDLVRIPVTYHPFLVFGTRDYKDSFICVDAIRSRIKIKCHNLLHHLESDTKFDYIFCRNVLIYFATAELKQVIANLLANIDPEGTLVLGLSESLVNLHLPVALIGYSCYRPLAKGSVGERPANANEEASGSPGKPSQIDRRRFNSNTFRPAAILIGASTGGPHVLMSLLAAWRTDSLPIVIVQHIDRAFIKLFAENMSRVSGLPLGSLDLVDGSQYIPLQNGKIYLPVDDHHIGLKEVRQGLVLYKSDDSPMHNTRPSVDFLFKSAAKTSRQFIAIILTGMGRDGAQGLKDLRDQGSYTLAQDKQSSTVYGMPGEANRLGGVIEEGDGVYLRTRVQDIVTGFEHQTYFMKKKIV